MSWTDSPFEAEDWVERTPNPAESDGVLHFGNLLPTLRWTGRFLIWALDHADTINGGAPQSVDTFGTSKKYISHLRFLSAAMTRLGLESLRDIGKRALKDVFVQFAGLAEGATPKSKDSVVKFAITLDRLYKLGPARDFWIPDGLMFNPRPVIEPFLNHPQLKDAVPTPELDDETARDLIAWACHWVEHLAAPVYAVVEVAAAVTAAKVRTKSKDVRNHERAVADLFETQPALRARFYAVREAFGVPLSSFVAGYSRNTRPDDAWLDALWLPAIARALRLRLQAMCYVVIAGFNGWRVNEILSVEDGMLRAVVSGWVLETTTRKTTVAPSAAERPVPPIAATAVEVLITLNRDQLTENDRRLFRCLSGARLTQQPLNRELTNLFRERFGEDAGKLRTHMFRRFLAMLWVRRFKGNMDALRRHFRHISRDMLWAYVHEAANAHYLVNEKRRLAREIAESLVFGEDYKSRWVGRKQRERFQYMACVMSLEDAARHIRQRIADDFTEVYPNEWGYCLYQKGQLGAACDAKEQAVEARAAPDTCGPCKFLCTGPENVPFWQQTALLHQDIVSSELTTPILKEASGRMLDTCRAVLSRHAADDSGADE